MLAVETRDLTHRFAHADVLRNISLRVPEGSIHGFLGPNGAGKTTTLRLVIGLLHRQHGSIEIFGRSLERNRIEILRRVGSSIETPSDYGHLTARENLEIWRRIFRCPPPRIDEVLTLVGLAAAGAKRADQFSLGMKQRLGIAHALLGDPSVLILDEPANGLDPAGIRWMRGLLKGYADRGGTVLLSSHLLNEVELIADELILIGRGRIVAQGDKESLLATKQSTSTLVTAEDNDQLVHVLKAKGYDVSTAGSGLRVEVPPIDVGRAAAENRIVLTDLRSADGGLEELFLTLTEDVQRDDIAGQPAATTTEGASA
jgi:ABC-2 type transport system ATP-binding protein